jgi:starvation-inducible DNA-binding protein
MANQAATQAKEIPRATHETPTDLSREGVAEITAALRQLLADTFALYLKTKNFHWHMTGPHFRDYHLLLDEQGEQIFDMTDERLQDNNDERVAAKDMLAELSADNQALARYFRSAHEICEKYNDVATASEIEVWIDQTERRTWFLSEIVQGL